MWDTLCLNAWETLQEKRLYHPLFDFVSMSLIDECNDHLENSTWDPHCLHSFFLLPNQSYSHTQCYKNGKIVE